MVNSAVLDINALAEDVRRRGQGRPRILVGIDGPGASGKSTLAAAFAVAIPGAVIVHVDDFYLPSKDQGSRVGEIASHFDWPRLTEQVIRPASTGAAVRYQRYDWNEDELAEWIEVPAGRPIIIEGVYCLEETLRDRYTYTIFCQADPRTRLGRGLERDGEEARSMWVDEWMPAEDEYIATQHPAHHADLVVDSSVDGYGVDQFVVIRWARA
ncbi:uridine kinase family protein [Phytohabitans sp. LJ34]|uniref:uridine kinase family protein n=1 Tax=Phytohabitans sp. LJ34 TaxID=3452217 RepID=UPI003F8B189E